MPEYGYFLLDYVISEAFEFPMWRLDWRDRVMLPVVAREDSTLVNGNIFRMYNDRRNFNLYVAMHNTFEASSALVHDELWEFNYRLDVTMLNHNQERPEWKNMHNRLAVNGVTLVLPELMMVEASFAYWTSTSWLEYRIPMETLYDPVTVYLFSGHGAENVVALNIALDAQHIEKIPVVYDPTTFMYSFEIRESGVFVLVYDDFEVADWVDVPDLVAIVPPAVTNVLGYDAPFAAPTPPVTTPEEVSERNYSLLIVLGGALVVLVVLQVMIYKTKRRS